jgi:hypothetical protein
MAKNSRGGQKRNNKGGKRKSRKVGGNIFSTMQEEATKALNNVAKKASETVKETAAKVQHQTNNAIQNVTNTATNALETQQMGQQQMSHTQAPQQMQQQQMGSVSNAALSSYGGKNRKRRGGSGFGNLKAKAQGFAKDKVGQATNIVSSNLQNMDPTNPLSVANAARKIQSQGSNLALSTARDAAGKLNSARNLATSPHAKAALVAKASSMVRGGKTRKNRRGGKRRNNRKTRKGGRKNNRR